MSEDKCCGSERGHFDECPKREKNIIAALKAEVESWKSEYDRASKSGTEYAAENVGLKAEVEASGEIIDGFIQERNAYALSLKDAREVLKSLGKFIKESEHDDSCSWLDNRSQGCDCGKVVRMEIADKVLSRTADPTALLEVHDREREAKVWEKAAEVINALDGLGVSKRGDFSGLAESFRKCAAALRLTDRPIVKTLEGKISKKGPCRSCGGAKEDHYNGYFCKIFDEAALRPSTEVVDNNNASA